MISFKTLSKITLNTLIGIILIFVWSRFVNLEEIWQTLKTADIKIALLFFILFICSHLSRALRLNYLLKNHKIGFRNILFINFLSQFLSFTIPIRAGEVVKSAYISQTYHIPLGKSLVWIFIDRFLDLWVTLVLIAVLLFIVPANLPQNFSNIVIALIAIFTILVLFAIYSSPILIKLIHLLKHLFVHKLLKEKFFTFAENIIHGFDILKRHPKDLIILIVLSILPTLTDGLIWYICFLALGESFNYLTLWLGNLLTALTYLIPAAPGYVGNAEASGFAVFSLALGLDKTLVSAATVLNHILTALIIPVIGLIGFYNLDFNFKEIFKKIFNK